MAKELARELRLRAGRGGAEVLRLRVSDNHQRLRVHDLDKAVKCDRLELRVLATNGDADARVYEIRAYG